MADARRLGKRGSYRLGRMGAPPPPRTPWPSAHHPTFAPHRRGPVSGWLLACLAAAVIVAGAALAGWWFLPFLAGLPAAAAAAIAVTLLAAAIAVTLLVAAIQAIVGLWLGRALAPGHG